MTRQAGVKNRADRLFWPLLGCICLAGAIVRWLLRADYLAHNPLATHPIVMSY